MEGMNRLMTLLARQRLIAAGVVAALLLLGAVLYPSLPARMAIHWNASGQADGTAAKPIAVLAMPAIVALVSVLLDVTDSDVGDRVVGSAAMLLLLVVQVAVLLVNLGVGVPIVPLALAGAFVVVVLAVRFETRSSRT
jgi:uncharacterized membrane protein